MRLDEQIAKIVKANGANFYGTETAQDDGNTIFRVFITREGGVSLDLCAEISNELSPFFDVNPPMHDAYYLEVSSPGIERKLENPTHFISAVGERVKFKIHGGDKIKGEILSADKSGFSISVKKEEIRFEYNNISKAKTYFEWNKSKWMRTEVVNPHIGNFVKSLRDVGYTFEIAVADVLDNSITANATEIKIHTVPKPKILFVMLDNGDGMSEDELTEAMRLATKNPKDSRDKRDLGRFGLGLKTASFSQCKKLTVLSKKDKIVSIKQWDLEYISSNNSWLLITPKISDFKNSPLVKEFNSLNHGTLVIWQDIDRYREKAFSDNIEKLRKHLSLVFHIFLENRVKISLNSSYLKPFNPFNAKSDATFKKSSEKIKLFGSNIKITPYILPHHSKVSQQEWNRYSTDDGYIKSQGFYLYRANRLLIHGTWWGLHKAIDAHKLVRIRIDITNEQDSYWGIDIKKSSANPISEIKKDLKRVIAEVTKEGVKPFIARAKKIEDKTTTRFWSTIPMDSDFRFGINKEHPIYQKLRESMSDETLSIFNIYLKGLEAYLPLESIQSNIQQNPHKVKQEEALSQEDLESMVEKLKSAGLSEEYIQSLLKTEMFKNKRELLLGE